MAIEGIIDKVGTSSHVLLVILNIIYFGTLFGIIVVNPTYINTFNICVHTFLCLFLIYRFNPLRKNIEVKQYDKVIIFSSAVFLLINLGVVEIVKKLFLIDTNTLNIFENSTKTSS
jgi:hypothetical protein